MTDFYAAVLAAQPQPAEDGMSMWRLTSPHDATQPLRWPMLDHQVLLERDFYSRFFSEKKWLGSLAAAGPQRKFVVLGQPGIGKSAFGWWLVAQLLRSGRTVVYSRNSAKRGTPTREVHYVFHRNVGFRTIISDLGATHELLTHPSVVHICDSCKPLLEGDCHKIMLTSPDPDMWRWFVEKEFAGCVYFPLYNGAELEVLRAGGYGTVLPKDVLALRRKAWGDVTRHLFALDQSAVKDCVLQALNNIDLSALQRAMTEIQTSRSRPTDESPHSLFLLNADRATLKSGSASFRSEAICRRTLRVLAAHQYSELLQSLQQLLESRTTKGIAGDLFEIAVIDGRARGGSLTCRRLLDTATASTTTTESTTRLVLNKSSLSISFDTLATISKGCKSNVWSLSTNRFVPVSPNFASIDLIETGLQLWQITTKHAHHELKVTSGRSDKEGLAAIAIELLPHMRGRWGSENAYLEVYFIVPEGCAAKFELQKLEFYNARVTQERTADSPLSAVGECGEVVKIPSKPELQAEPVQGSPSSFRVRASGGKLVTVEVRQFVVEMPLSATSSDAPRDVIDEAGET